MGSFVRSERILNILCTLQRQPGIKTKELAELFDCVPRTIQRDIAVLRRLGFAVDASAGPEGGFICRGRYRLKPLTFSGEEAMALFVAARVLLEKEGFPYKEDLRTALAKISQAVREKETNLLADLEPRVSLAVTQLKDYTPWGAVFEGINQAILDRKRLALVYDSYTSGGLTERKVDPYHVMFRSGFWYLIGYDDRRQAVRIFRIDRIQKIAITDEPFTLPAEFSLKEYINNSWELGKGELVTVKIHFFPPVSRLIREGQWHSTQQLELLPGDELIFTATVEGTWEIKKWALGWGKYAEVLEPKELREEIAVELQTMIEQYGK